jgi:hypothetical protein
MKECWFCKSSIDVENDKWMSVGLLFPNSKGADIDIHKDCFDAFSYTKVMMCNEKVEVAKCWICHNSIPISSDRDWVFYLLQFRIELQIQRIRIYMILLRIKTKIVFLSRSTLMIP